ncbi:hypothetical protein C7B79_03150 [Chroococcidiopsis cubana CCALA 043]|uniref:hypothetical protein n=1 Tax=Chroococcidiopsis cubana TaxID=171392 RepID=UPI000D4B73B1|nr:hypothetical protein [Chroococcidiopsis cubana]PSB65944.1 hypothetical protein C7B79_03150 [Chroococcidiopsis cubana CCALA 043]
MPKKAPTQRQLIGATLRNTKDIVTMTAQIIASSAPQAQIQTPQVWDKPTAAAQVGDEICAPFTPVMQVVEREVLADGRVRLLVKPGSATYSEEWIVAPQATVEQQPTQATSETTANQQPIELKGDCTHHQPQPDWEAIAEYESGSIHGKHDASARIPPMCKQASCPYSQGYLDGYSSIKASQPPASVPKAVEWQVVYDPKWDLYQVWVENRCLMEKAISYAEGEKIAQKYIAAEKLRASHRELVMSAFAA